MGGIGDFLGDSGASVFGTFNDPFIDRVFPDADIGNGIDRVKKSDFANADHAILQNKGSSLAARSQQGKDASQTGVNNLLQLLQQNGRTDPAFRNQQLAGIARGTNTQRDAGQARVRQSGLQNSGVGAALDAAISAGGADRRSGFLASEEEKRFGRQQQNLQQLVNMLIQPGLVSQGQGLTAQNQLLGLDQNAQNQNIQNILEVNNQRNAATGQTMQAVGNMFSLFGGGGG